MAASNPTDILTGSDGVRRSLDIPQWTGKILESFRLNTVLYNQRNRMLDIRPCQGAASVQFDIVGFNPRPEYTADGVERLGQQQPFDKITISPDDTLSTDREVGMSNRLLSHFDPLPTWVPGMGQSLAEDFDGKGFRMAVKSARTAAKAGFHNGGQVVNRVGGATTIADCYPATATGAANLRADIRRLARLLDDAFAPEPYRYGFITPYGHEVLSNDPTLFSRDYVWQDENKAIKRVLGEVEGFIIQKSAGIPSTNFINTGSDVDPTKYDLDCRYVAGNVAAGTGQPIFIALCGGDSGTAAVGVAMAEEFVTKYLEDVRRNTLYTRCNNLFGMGVVAPWMAGVVQAQLS